MKEKLRNVGVARFNSDHEKLVDFILAITAIVDQLKKRKPEPSDWIQLEKLFNELKSYTRYHFQAEEDLFAKMDYPKKKEHAQEHRRLIETLDTLAEKIAHKEIAYSVDLQFFLLDWLFSHINRHDMQYKEFFNAKGVR
ncbi:MAG: hemerythrin family protein [Magnetococcales bacterium]|nr:hemerythrin family protein [Magnetococcales bacterium]